ncbi:MAG: substrate-binding domain-containing protein [Anaerolineae bacterium]|nr:substrate-binding domain-containing protein [Anaerolineae bacterium]
MKRGTIVLGIFILVVIGLIAASQIVQNQPPITITVAVSPLLESWMRPTVSEFNAQNRITASGRRVSVTVQLTEDLDVWSGNNFWTSTNHPDAWIPAASFSIGYARNMPFIEVKPSVAKTPLIWGGYAERINVITDGSANPLNWDAVFTAAASDQNWQTLGGQSNWGFLKIAFPRADDNIVGLAALLTAAADFSDQARLTGVQLSNSAYRDAFSQVLGAIPSFNSIGGNAAGFVARGVSSADFGLAAESQWLQSVQGMARMGTPRFEYPDPTVMFEFPLARWDDSSTTEDQRQAVNLFADWLTGNAQQIQLPQAGLRPVERLITDEDRVFADAQTYGIVLVPDLANVVSAPTLNDLRGLLSWFQSVAR